MKVVAVAELEAIRDRVLPMFELVAEEYGPRTPAGYPEILDDPERGVIGLLLDPSFSIHFVSDGTGLFVDMMTRSSRNDARSSASREKYAGMPFNDHRALNPSVTDQELRNLIAELLSRWNTQPSIIHMTDT